MYFSQNAIILVMLMFVISTVYYSTVEYQTKSVEDEIKIKEVTLHEKNIVSTIDRNINKIVEDAFINASYKIMKTRRFFNSSNEAVSYITDHIINETNQTLKCLVGNYSNISFNIKYISIYPTDDPLKIDVSGDIELTYKKKLNNGEIIGLKNIYINKVVKLSRIPDPYVYLNKFYYTWGYERKINIYNFPNDAYNHTFYIVLNDSNFNYSEMYDPTSPKEIRIIGWNSTSGKWNILLPYWVQVWREGPNEESIIWIKANKNEIPNGYIYLLYDSTTPIDRQDPEDTFIFFDHFRYFDPDKWSSIGESIINNSNITVIAGAGSSVYTKQLYDTGYELMFRANFTPSHSQGVGFFNPLNIDDGVGWDCYQWNPNWLCMRVGSSNYLYVPNGANYLDKFYIYDIKRISSSSVSFAIYNDTLKEEYEHTFTNVNDIGLFPISINAIPPTGEVTNANVTVDWIFLKDINDITTTIGAEYTNPEYKEEKPKTLTGTIYYGEPEEYILVNNGTYSIIGLFTNKSDYWGSVGYKPLIEEN